MSDRDCLACLSMSGLGGRNGMLPPQYGELSDRQIYALLTISWDDDGKLELETEQPRYGRERVPTGSIAAAGRELPSFESMGITDAELDALMSIRPFISTFYVAMFFSVWFKRGKTKEEIVRIWKEHLASDN